ncbi:MACRO domain-containing protein 1, partial [Aphelenchoides avenae]
GDWKQLCPVVKNVPRELAQAATVNASVKSSSLYRQFHKLPLTQNMRVKKGQQEWAEYIARVGNGKTNIVGTSEMEVDPDLLVPSEGELIEFTFPQKLLDAPFANTAALLEAAILAPKLDTVRRLNDRIRLLLPGTDIVCASTDTPMSEDPLTMLDVHYAARNVEHLNRRTEEGMPPHLLTFRPGMVLVLMRNIDQYMGLCNGTRLHLIGKFGENLKCTVLSGPMAKAGGYTLIPRVRFEYGRKSDETNIDRFVRIQYPVIPAFAMTINKAQGQTLQRVGLHLGTQVFSHGQVYTGFSRVTSREGIKIFNDRPKRPNFIINRVYEELLDAESARTPPPIVPESQRIDRDQWPSVPGLDTTPPASWTRGVNEVDGLDFSVHSDDPDVADDATAVGNDNAEFTEGRAPDIVAYQQRDTDHDLDWTGVEFGFDEPADTQPPNRNVFNLLFPAGEQIDTAAWDFEPKVPYKITLIKADITKIEVDAVVNAANAQLRAGGGVCGAIFKAAGHAQLQHECDLYGGCQTGDAVITGAYGMKQVRNIIHAVGPVVLARNVTRANARDLGTCYTRSLDLAKEHGLRSIAFPCISTAIFGYPIDDATPVALMSVQYWLSQRDNAESMDKVVFCVFSDADLNIYRALLLEYFDVYFDHELMDFVTRAVDDDRFSDDDHVSASRMTVVVDSVSFSRSSQNSCGNARPHTALPSARRTPVEELQRRSQPPKWPRELLDLDIDVLRRNVMQGRADMEVDEEERVDGM